MTLRLQTQIRTFALLAAFIACAAFLPLAAHAQPNPNPQPSPVQSNTDTSGGDGHRLENPLTVNSLDELIDVIIKGVVQLGGIALTIALVVIGFRFVNAQGKPEELKKVRTALMWTIIGGIILLGASAISALVSNTVQNL